MHSYSSLVDKSQFGETGARGHQGWEKKAASSRVSTLKHPPTPPCSIKHPSYPQRLHRAMHLQSAGATSYLFLQYPECLPQCLGSGREHELFMEGMDFSPPFLGLWIGRCLHKKIACRHRKTAQAAGPWCTWPGSPNLSIPGYVRGVTWLTALLVHIRSSTHPPWSCSK